MTTRQKAIEAVALEIRIFNRRRGLHAYAAQDTMTIGEIIDAHLPLLDIDGAGWNWQRFAADVNKFNQNR